MIIMNRPERGNGDLRSATKALRLAASGAADENREVTSVRKTLAIALICIPLVAAGASARTWYVYPTGVGGNAPTIQAAVDSAAVSGDVIMLKAGVFHEQDIVIDGKSILIDQSEGQAYIRAPFFGSGTCFTVRNTPSGFTINSVSLRGFATAVAFENASGFVQFIAVRGCDRAVSVSGGSSAPTIWYGLIDSCGVGIEVSGGSAVTIRNETIVHCGTGVRFAGGATTLTRSILYGCAAGVSCAGGAVASSCNDLFANAVDFAGCSAGATDFFSDPMFCFAVAPAPGLYWLHKDSPCFTKANPCGLTVGAFVTAAGCTGTAVEPATWGSIKDMYR